MIRKEIQQFLDILFDGSASPLVSHLADMDALSVEDLRELEKQLETETAAALRKSSEAGERGKGS
jgi:predicted transcriptional regulator